MSLGLQQSLCCKFPVLNTSVERESLFDQNSTVKVAAQLVK